MSTPEDKPEEKIEAAVLRRLLKHLSERADVQNIDLMGYGGFCRNCLADWYKEAAEEQGLSLSKDEARERIYGMPYEDYKEKHQLPATDEQMRRMEISVAKNRVARADG
ncbi:DUF1244 domain-containing protein [Kordiimonas aestuarii]|uniref:DUF1244 domain-containing protein n=1 Tax=Kordiimonas aestuarii TaxID=1005925 RepID=UPI0021CFBE7C|nr:DUF1244 domain-containing protein [Kordiimonas aestuarii]